MAVGFTPGEQDPNDPTLFRVSGKHAHAWPEVYLNGWVAVDPTFGQFPADATHIRLVEGGPDRQVAIVKLVGKLKVKILEFK